MHTYTHAYVYAYTHAYVHTYMHMHTCIYAYAYMHMHMCMHTYTCIHVHTHIHTCTRRRRSAHVRRQRGLQVRKTWVHSLCPSCRRSCERDGSGARQSPPSQLHVQMHWQHWRRRARARPDIPRPAADEDVDDDADDGGAGRSAGADGAGDGHAGGPSTRGRLLGRRVLSLNQGRFWPGTVALYSPTATKWLYLVHWDDGVTHKWDGEPDCDGPDGQSTVQLLEETVQ